MHKIIGMVLLAVIVIAGAFYYLGYGKFDSNRTENYENTNGRSIFMATSHATYICSEDKSFSVGYAEGAAEVILAPNSKYILEQSVSASGSRYASKDKNFIFWSKGPDAYIEQDGRKIFSDCTLLKTSGGEIEIIEASINQEISAKGVRLRPLLILEDSRCPVDVVCIQAGTVRIKTRLGSAMGEADQIFKLNETVTTEAESITLVRVLPVKFSNIDSKASDYLFYFEIKKR